MGLLIPIVSNNPWPGIIKAVIYIAKFRITK